MNKPLPLSRGGGPRYRAKKLPFGDRWAVWDGKWSRWVRPLTQWASEANAASHAEELNAAEASHG